MKNIIILFIVFFFCANGIGQNGSIPVSKIELEPLMIQTKPSEIGLRIKFIPSNAQVWLQSIENGFIVQRVLLGKEKKTLELLTKSPIKPAQANAFTDKELAAAQDQLLWQPLKKYKEKVAEGEIFQAGMAMENVYSYYILVTTREAEASRNSGMEFIDKTAQRGKIYRYEISIAGVEKTVENSARFIHGEGTSMTHAPSIYSENGDKSALLKWKHNPDYSPFLAYYLEKSENGIDFDRVTKEPIYFTNKSQRDTSFASNSNMLYYRDTLLQNERKHQYRLVGLDYFGELSEPSAMTEVVSFDQTAPAIPNKHKVKVIGEKGKEEIILTWSKKEKEADFAGYIIMRAEPDETYKPLHKNLLLPNTESYTDASAKEGIPYYYTILATDKTENYQATPVMSATLPDYTAPTTPVGIKAEISQAGEVQITWKSNSEKDIKGYRVFGSNHEKTDYLSLTPMPLESPLFTDTLTLNRLNEKYYYRIVAFDNYYNHSEYSEVITIQIPDTIAPRAPLSLNGNQKENTISLTWKPSNSKDVVAQRIMRQESETKEWKTISELKGNRISTFEDVITNHSNYLGYCIVAVDDVGLISEQSNTVFFDLSNKNRPEEVSSFSATKQKDNTVEISWNNENMKAGNRFLLYKYIEGERPKLLRSIDGNLFIDKALQKGNVYEYFIVAQDKNGHRSEKSEVVKVQLF
ncbi:MAG: fibronectin type 3 domain-containing protein [Saprospiraceae bacterium]|jgi:fibronectin type 3 domain-containing protein